MLAVNLIFLAVSLSLSVAITLSTSLISVAVLPTDKSREPCHIEYSIVIYLVPFVSLFNSIKVSDRSDN